MRELLRGVKHEVKQPAWCPGLVASCLLAYGAPAFSQEPDHTPSAESSPTFSTVHSFNGTDGKLPFAASPRPPMGTCTGQPIMAAPQARGTFSGSALRVC